MRAISRRPRRSTSSARWGRRSWPCMATSTSAALVERLPAQLEIEVDRVRLAMTHDAGPAERPARAIAQALPARRRGRVRALAHPAARGPRRLSDLQPRQPDRPPAPARHTMGLARVERERSPSSWSRSDASAARARPSADVRRSDLAVLGHPGAVVLAERSPETAPAPRPASCARSRRTRAAAPPRRRAPCASRSRAAACARWPSR